MKLGIVVPRYGDDAVGGAEKAMRMIGERLVAFEGWEVEVFTTCARSAITWEDVETPGLSSFNGVTVNRFESKSGRDPEWHHIATRVDYSPTSLDAIGEAMFVDQQGPVCPDVIEAAEASDADLIAFSPYLFWPSIRGVPIIGKRAILHGAAHDEAALRLDLVQQMYTAAGALSYYTDAERELAERFFPVVHKPSVTLGLGIDVPDDQGDVDEARDRFGLSDRPYVVCVGRVENGKGARALDAFFREYKRRRPSPLALVFVGPASEKLDPHPDVVMTDAVDEATKWALVRGAEVSISPSAMESFSMVILEAWLADTAVLVNAQCGATVEHAHRARGGLWFGDYPTFEAALDRLMGDPDLRALLAANGRRYTEQVFAWEAVIGRYVAFCETVLSGLRAGGA
ncbi:MAG: glycosyltransferase family 4 protein [Acidimicrobiales bacterium]|nr:glycosyltransferase family 4 protein [Acidimicrobiales bacterium]